MSETVDLYKVLGVSRTCTVQEIKTAHKKLVLRYHPDRGGDPELFEIVNNAYNILVNAETRGQYDILFKQSEETKNSYRDLKAQAREFAKSQPTEATEQTKADFNAAWNRLNEKHNYYEEGKDDMRIPLETAVQNWQDVRVNRKKHYEEDKPERIFDPNAPFDSEKFNMAFDDHHGSITDLVEKKDVPDAWNGTTDNMTTYSNVNDYENVYDDGADVNNLHGINFGLADFDKGKNRKNLTIADMKNVGKADYVKGHNKIGKDYYTNIKQRLAEREIDNKKFDDKEMHQYDKEATAGYGIFEKLGINYDDRLNITDWEDKNVNTAYQKLLADRART